MNFRFLCSTTLLAGAAVILAGCAREHRAVVVVDKPLETPYQTPLLSPGAQFAALPPVIQHTIRAETGAAEIDKIIKDTNSGPVVYRVYFVHHDAFPPLYIGADGSVLNPDLSVAVGASKETVKISSGGAATGLSTSDLPPNVMKTVQRQEPEAEIDTITKETRGDQTVYIFTFKGRRHPRLMVAADGSVILK